ncbi:hypothetical protein ACFE04_004795 [Oxalis oulophora]
MSKGLDMSLDDIIKSNKTSGSGPNSSRGRGGGGGGPRGGGGGSFNSGPARRFPNRAVNRAAPYGVARAPAVMAFQQHGMFPDLAATAPVAASALETGTKLYISNLDYGVSNEDIKELFAEVGDLKKYSIHYDKSGRSKGTAEVIFSRQADAMAAVKRYDNVQLDGKPMKIEIIGTNFSTPAAPPILPMAGAFGISNGSFGIPNGVPRGGHGGRGGAFGRLRGSSRGGRGRGFGRGGGRGGERRGGRGEKVSVDDLDADLDKYHSQNSPIAALSSGCFCIVNPVRTTGEGRIPILSVFRLGIEAYNGASWDDNETLFQSDDSSTSDRGLILYNLNVHLKGGSFIY